MLKVTLIKISGFTAITRHPDGKQYRERCGISSGDSFEEVQAKLDDKYAEQEQAA